MGQGGKTITGLAKELGVRRKFLYLWRDQLQAGEAGDGRNITHQEGSCFMWRGSFIGVLFVCPRSSTGSHLLRAHEPWSILNAGASLIARQNGNPGPTIVHWLPESPV